MVAQKAEKTDTLLADSKEQMTVVKSVVELGKWSDIMLAVSTVCVKVVS